MNKDQFLGRWREFKGKIKEKWGKLTDDDISQINGKWDQLSGALQRKYGWTKEQAEREMNHWCAACEQRKEHKTESGIKREEENQLDEGSSSRESDHRNNYGDRPGETRDYRKEDVEEKQQPRRQNEQHEKNPSKKDHENKEKKRQAG